MSFFVGKDSSGNNSMIVTRSSVSESVIKSNIFSSNIVFSSKYPYAVVEYEVFTSPTVSVIGGRYPAARKECVIYLSSSFISTYNASSKTRALLVFVDGDIIVPRDLYSLPYDLSFKRYYNNVANGYIKIVTDYSFAYSKVEVVMLPYTSTFTSINPNLYGGTVSIGNGDIQLNANSFFKSKFLLGGSVNSVDPVISFLGKSYQIVNASTTSGSLSINCDTNSRTTILNNSKIILDSNSSIYTPIVADSFSNIYTNYSSNFYFGDFSGYSSTIVAVPSPDSTKFYLVAYKVWGPGEPEPEYSLPYIVKTGSSGNIVIGYDIMPGASGGTCFYELTLYLTPEGKLGFSKKLLYCSGGAGPITNVYYGPYNIRVKSRIIG